MPEAPSVRVLTAADAPAYREVRLAGLQTDPLAFVTAADEFAARPASEIAGRLDPGAGVVTLGAFVDGTLVGILTVVREALPTLAHRANVVAVSVLPHARGQGCGDALLRAGIAQARTWPGVSSLHLAVVETQHAARRLYERHGFRHWGTRPDALHVEGRSLAEHWLWLDLTRQEA
ncbi:GNAT family N-acetyltransferase [Deinococcus metallilatus]|uniref:GNAT family N-acetyltransferase n=1 Tax=Deinococcus metallilatus TaxID=1211322 RepID=A0AAJ5F5Q7_9DEIO|nr:GNAT family N-acetyltransferase [Deinococcus metallilatus]MBB5294393.1 GNAT superfamily N-acetyltransferase [Deinococcus metallilatus]QBY10148.1 GNAT family N-acetyltransferase [Deinococcus metallilatus]RXJ13874.1 GNAT family N-acetyltransferase [Deinococcus metallilatus]TLK29840.1 GNAT family N-acetyltransferase [Deinococcus metallilatus]GMA15609.1 N-acetyltransferase [Deinococcus metallilatus]